jgi:chromosome segregation ATPase
MDSSESLRSEMQRLNLQLRETNATYVEHRRKLQQARDTLAVLLSQSLELERACYRLEMDRTALERRAESFAPDVEALRRLKLHRTSVFENERSLRHAREAELSEMRRSKFWRLRNASVVIRKFRSAT